MNKNTFINYISLVVSILLVALLLVHLSIATTPLDQLVQRNESRQVIDLNNLDPISALNIEQLHRELVKTEKWQMADLGYLYGYEKFDVQSMGDLDTDAIKKFINSTDELPISVGNDPGTNFYEINDTSQIPYY